MLIENLYSVTQIETKEDGFTAHVHLNKDHEVFKGHFPGNPVMPGVCMIQMIKELTEKETQKTLFLTQSSNIKFMAIINPEINPNLQVEIAITKNEDEVKIKNVTSYDTTVALKLNAVFKVMD